MSEYPDKSSKLFASNVRISLFYSPLNNNRVTLSRGVTLSLKMQWDSLLKNGVTQLFFEVNNTSIFNSSARDISEHMKRTYMKSEVPMLWLGQRSILRHITVNLKIPLNDESTNDFCC